MKIWAALDSWDLSVSPRDLGTSVEALAAVELIEAGFAEFEAGVRG